MACGANVSTFCLDLPPQFYSGVTLLYLFLMGLLTILGEIRLKDINVRDPRFCFKPEPVCIHDASLLHSIKLSSLL